MAQLIFYASGFEKQSAVYKTSVAIMPEIAYEYSKLLSLYNQFRPTYSYIARQGDQYSYIIPYLVSEQLVNINIRYH